MRSPFFALLSIASALSFAVTAAADPIVGRDIFKFQQRPMFNTAIPGFAGEVERFHGHDELSTAYAQFDNNGNLLGFVGRFMADDFADRFETPVVHVKWWGTYIGRRARPIRASTGS